MLRMVIVFLWLGSAVALSGQGGQNPFDLKFRSAGQQSSPAKTEPVKVSADTAGQVKPIQKIQEPEAEAKPETEQPDTISGSRSTNSESGVSGSNPFDLKNGKQAGSSNHVDEKKALQPKFEQKQPEVKFHQNPDSKPFQGGQRHISKGIQIFFILLSLLFLIFIVNVERNFVRDLWRVIANENYSSIHIRNQRNTMRQILLIMGYVVFFIQAGIFFCHVIALFGYEDNLLSNVWACVGFVVIIYAIRHLVIRYLRWLFNNDKEMRLFGFDISTFNIMVGLVLLPVNVLLNFGPESISKPLVIIGLVVIVVAYLMRQLRWMLTARGMIANSLFLFFVYLCAVEILPLWAILKIFW